MSHLRSAFRSLIKSPLVTTIAVLSLALGIGANAAIFSIFERLVLRPLPVEAPEELVNLSAPGPKSGWMSSNNAGNSQSTFSYPMFRDLESQQTAFDGLAAHCGFGANLAFDDRSLSGGAMYVSGGYFGTLGLQPALGRLLGPDDDVTEGAHPLVVLDHRFWRDQFGLDPNVIDKRLVVNGQTMTIIGVAPEGFSGTTLGSDPQIYVPISMRAVLNAGWDHFENRRAYWVYMFARLADGDALESAQTAINVPFSQIIQDVDLPLQGNMSETNQKLFAETRIVLEPGPRGQSSLHGEIRPPVLLLFCVTAFVLLIACANLVNLLLVRAAHRSGEIAVRMSIGARRHQIVAQLLTESFLLALFGSAFGMVVALGTLHLISGLIPQGMGPSFEFQVGASAWWFCRRVDGGHRPGGSLPGPAKHSAGLRRHLEEPIRAQLVVPRRGPLSQRHGHGSNRPLHGPAHRRRSIRQEPLQRQPGGSRSAGRKRGGLRRLSGTQRLHPGGVPRPLRTHRSRRADGSGHQLRGRLRGSTDFRQQLGQ